MIFSDKIYKIIDGKNVTLFAKDNSTLNIYLYNKSLKMYEISTILNRNCVFSKSYNFKKIIQLNNTLFCGSNGYINLDYEK